MEGFGRAAGCVFQGAIGCEGSRKVILGRGWHGRTGLLCGVLVEHQGATDQAGESSSPGSSTCASNEGQTTAYV